MRARRLIVLLLIAAVASLGTTSTQLAAPSNFAPISQATSIPMLPGTTQPIAISPGNQNHPHLACGLATYTNDDFEGISSIRYLDFATNTEHIVPGGSAVDRLADTDGRRIAFTRIQAGEDLTDHIAIYDIAFEYHYASPRQPKLRSGDWRQSGCVRARH